MPSSRRQISATAGALRSDRQNDGSTATARAMNRRTASNSARASSAMVWPGSGTASAGIRYAVSPAMRSRSRLDASTFTFEPACSRRMARSAQASTRCSQLSRISSSVSSPTCFTMASTTDCPASSLRPSVAAKVCGTSVDSLTGAKSTNQTPSGNSSSSEPATCNERRVLPRPPAPTSVRSPVSPISFLTSANSRSRPMKALGCRGRLFGVASSPRSAGKFLRSCGCSS